MGAREQIIPTGARRSLLAALLAGVGLLALLAVLPAIASAATIRVTGKFDQPANDTVCMLREAVIAANTDSPTLGCPAGTGDDVIVLPAGTYKLTRPPGSAFDPRTGSLDINDPQGQDLLITGFGGPVTIDASVLPGGGDRAIVALSPLALNYLTVTGGDSSSSPEMTGYGGAIATLFSLLKVRHSLIAGSNASLGGGGIFSSGQLDMANSTVSGNSVTGTTSAVGGGGIDASSPAAFSRVTIAGNSVTTTTADGVGGGLRFGGSLSLQGSIIADNSADGSDPDCFNVAAPQSSVGLNVIEHASAGCGLTLLASDAEADPQLSPITDNGGATSTYAIPPGSPAANRGPLASSPSCRGATDQRGVPRGVAESGACDAGAYEIYTCAALPVNVVGTAAGDTLRGSQPQVSAAGFGGGDLISGGPGDDALCGGDGTDVLDGGPGADSLLGGAGTDIVTYGAVGTPIAVILDGAANDGRAGESDLVVAESVIGGSAADLIVGSAVANGVHGGAGADRIDGGDGNDSLLGQAGDDVVNGSAGNDQIRGGDDADQVLGGDGDDRVDGEEGADTVNGGAGNDRLYGGGGPNTLLGSDGNDQLYGGPAKDLLKCGGGRDLAVAGKKDTVAGDCEKVKRG